MCVVGVCMYKWVCIGSIIIFSATWADSNFQPAISFFHSKLGSLNYLGVWWPGTISSAGQGVGGMKLKRDQKDTSFCDVW